MFLCKRSCCEQEEQQSELVERRRNYDTPERASVLAYTNFLLCDQSVYTKPLAKKTKRTTELDFSEADIKSAEVLVSKRLKQSHERCF